MAKPKKLYRSERDRMLAGVAGGLAEYLDVDATIVRLAFVISTIFWGFGLIVYILMWVLVPSQSNVNLSGQEIINKNVDELSGKAREAGEKVKQKVEEVTQEKPKDESGDQPQ